MRVHKGGSGKGKLMEVKFKFPQGSVLGAFGVWLLLLCLGLTVFFPACAHRPLSEVIVPQIEGLKEGYTDIGGCRMHYVEKGEGEPVILLHGFGGNVSCWRRNIEPLARQFRVIAVDFPGFGLSDIPQGRDWRLETFHMDLVKFMDERHIAQAHLVGNSMGGGIAWATAHFSPERVKSLSLIDSIAYPFKFILEFNVIKTPGLGPAALAVGGRAAIHFSLWKSIYYDAAKITATTIEGYAAPLRNPGTRMAMHQILRVNKVEKYKKYQELLPQIKTPALIVWGENDAILPVAQAHQLHRDLSNSQLLIIPACGHCPNEEKPEEVNPALIKFIAAQSAPSR